MIHQETAEPHLCIHLSIASTSLICITTDFTAPFGHLSICRITLHAVLSPDFYGAFPAYLATWVLIALAESVSGLNALYFGKHGGKSGVPMQLTGHWDQSALTKSVSIA